MLRDSVEDQSIEIEFFDNVLQTTPEVQNSLLNLFWSNPPIGLLLILPNIAYDIAHQASSKQYNQLAFNGMK